MGLWGCEVIEVFRVFKVFREFGCGDYDEMSG